jgi:hypothetical protein
MILQPAEDRKISRFHNNTLGRSAFILYPFAFLLHFTNTTFRTA